MQIKSPNYKVHRIFFSLKVFCALLKNTPLGTFVRNKRGFCGSAADLSSSQSRGFLKDISRYCVTAGSLFLPSVRKASSRAPTAKFPRGNSALFVSVTRKAGSRDGVLLTNPAALGKSHRQSSPSPRQAPQPPLRPPAVTPQGREPLAAPLWKGASSSGGLARLC